MESKICLIDHLDKRIDDCKQYYWRVSLRIDNIPLPQQNEKDYIEKVDAIMQSLDCGLQRTDIDWVHGISPKWKYDNGMVGQQMIIYFESFDIHIKICCNKMKIQNG